MSDWRSVYDGVAAAKNGLDLEMPDAQFMTKANLLNALAHGELTWAQIDDKVRRILRIVFSYHFYDRPMGKTLPLKDDAASDQTALEAARTGIVLLKNQDHLLPLKNIRKLLVVGPNGGSFIAGGGSSLLAPTHEVSLIDGLKALYPGAEINYRPVLLYSFKDKLPEKELKAFARIFLKKGGHKQVTFQLNKNSFSYYQEAKKRFGYNNDKFDILIASSSQDIRLQKTIQMRHAQ